MHIETIIEHDVGWLTIRGQINNSNSQTLFQEIDEASHKEARGLVLDLDAVDYMDSSGVGVLVAGYKLVKETGGRFMLIRVRERVMMVFEMTRLVKLFEIYADRDLALNALG